MMHDLMTPTTAFDVFGILSSGKQFISRYLGMPGLVAVIILATTAAVLLISKIVSIAFEIVRYVILPSVVLTFIATYFLPYSLFYMLPASIALFSLILIFRT
jgi:hypothetical protein